MDNGRDTIFQDHKRDEAAPKKVYVSVDHEHGRLYKLLMEEEFVNRLPYQIQFSPDYENCSSQAEREKLVKQMRESVKETDLFLVICAYDCNRVMPHCSSFGEKNWQNLEVAEAGKHDLPMILVRTQQTREILEQLEGMVYLETRKFDPHSIGGMLADAVRYWKL